MRRETHIIWLLLLLVTCFPPPSQSSCPTCPEGSSNYLDCGKSHWDGQDQRGESVAAAVYVAKLQAGGQTLTQKVVIGK